MAEESTRLNRVIDACRAVPDASVPADLLIDEPIITSSLGLVMQSVTNLLVEAIGTLKSMDKAAQEFAANELFFFCIRCLFLIKCHAHTDEYLRILKTIG